jgi:hypothetical protein
MHSCGLTQDLYFRELIRLGILSAVEEGRAVYSELVHLLVASNPSLSSHETIRSSKYVELDSWQVACDKEIIKFR